MTTTKNGSIAQRVKAKSAKIETFDDLTYLMVMLFRAVHTAQSDLERSAAEYVEHHHRDIERIGQLLEYLGLAEEDVQCPFGWKPTKRLLEIIARKAANPSKFSKRRITCRDQAMITLLCDAVWGTGRRNFPPSNMYSFAFDVLEGLGLMQRTTELEPFPTESLDEVIMELDNELHLQEMQKLLDIKPTFELMVTPD